MRAVDIPGHVPEVSPKLSTAAVKQAILDAGIEYLVTLPETPYELLLRDLIKDPVVKLVQVARESQGMSVCSGLTIGGKVACLLCSFKGLYNSVDSLLGVARRTEASFLILVSEAGVPAERAKLDAEYGRHSAKLLKALDIPYYEAWKDEDLALVKKAMADTKSNTQPVAVILRW